MYWSWEGVDIEQEAMPCYPVLRKLQTVAAANYGGSISATQVPIKASPKAKNSQCAKRANNNQGSETYRGGVRVSMGGAMPIASPG